MERGRWALAASVGAALAVLGWGVLPLAQTPVVAAAQCKVTDATLTWGFKASFRAYISGSIAHGDWSTSGNASYKTPNFSWRKGSGTFDPAATSGQVGFSGGIRFTGHDGILDSRFSNLRVTFTGTKTAALVLDYTGISMDEATSGSGDLKPTTYKNVTFASLALASGSRGGSGATTTFTSVPTSITKEGYAAFGSYEPGTALDPITISITADSSCASPTATATAKPTATTASSTPTTKVTSKATTKATSTKPTSKATSKATSRATTKPTPTPTASATPVATADPDAAGATTEPSIESANGLSIPAPSARATASPTAEPTSDPSTRSLDVIASSGPGTGGFGDGFLIGLAGFGVGIIATLLIQAAHLQLQNAQLRLQAKRKAAGVE